MATTRRVSTIIGGERAIVDMHGWNQQNGPGKVFHDLLVISACQILYGEYQNGNNQGLTAQAVHNIWNHAQLTFLWSRNSEGELKATIRALITHRRHKFASGLRRDWPSTVPKPPYEWFRQINSGAVDAGQTDQSDNMIPVSNMIPLSNMVIIVTRHNLREMFAIRIVRLLPAGQGTVTAFSMLHLNTLIYYLVQNQGLAFNAHTETLVWTDKEDGHAMPIDGQLAFEAALQMQYNSGVMNMKLEIGSNAINLGNIYPVNPVVQPQQLVNSGPQTMIPAAQDDGNDGTSDKRMHFDHTLSSAHPLSNTQELKPNVSSAEQQTADPFGAGPSVNDE